MTRTIIILLLLSGCGKAANVEKWWYYGEWDTKKVSKPTIDQKGSGNVK